MSQDRPLLVYRRLLVYSSPFWGRLVLIALALGLTSSSTLVIPWLCKNLFRAAVVSSESRQIHAALGLIVIAAALASAGRFVAEDQLGFVSARMVERLRNDLARKLARLPTSHLARARSGDALSRIFNDVHLLLAFLYDAVFALGADLLVVLGSIGFLFYLSWELALISLIGLPMAAAVVGAASRWVRRRFLDVQASLAEMTSTLSEQLSAMPAIRAFGGEEYEGLRFAQSCREYRQQVVGANRVQAGTRALLNLLGAVGMALVVGFGAGKLDSSAGAGGLPGLTLERLVGFALYAALLADPMTRFSRTNFDIQRALAAGRRVFELLDLPDERRDGARLCPASPFGTLRFESVSFHYTPDEPVLSAVNLNIEPCETLAVVGPSGAGKSTLVALALGFYEPVLGRVLLDGHDLRQLRLDDLRRHIGWVGPDPFLFCGTIAENIRYGSWHAGQADIERAAQLVCADSFIRELPRGYASRLGERGVNLSAGERARLALARVVLRAPAMVILDEATAALDSETEARLWNGLASWLAQRTTLIIAHRLRTVLTLPRIVVLEHGRKVGDGTAEHLERNCPTFRRIFVEQMNLVPRAA